MLQITLKTIVGGEAVSVLATTENIGACLNAVRVLGIHRVVRVAML